jgi:hypothetical protein
MVVPLPEGMRIHRYDHARFSSYAVWLYTSLSSDITLFKPLWRGHGRSPAEGMWIHRYMTTGKFQVAVLQLLWEKTLDNDGCLVFCLGPCMPPVWACVMKTKVRGNRKVHRLESGHFMILSVVVCVCRNRTGGHRKVCRWGNSPLYDVVCIKKTHRTTKS